MATDEKPADGLAAGRHDGFTPLTEVPSKTEYAI
jgi:hypothetical protein